MLKIDAFGATLGVSCLKSTCAMLCQVQGQLQAMQEQQSYCSNAIC